MWMIAPELDGASILRHARMDGAVWLVKEHGVQPARDFDMHETCCEKPGPSLQPNPCHTQQQADSPPVVACTS